VEVLHPRLFSKNSYLGHANYAAKPCGDGRPTLNAFRLFCGIMPQLAMA